MAANSPSSALLSAGQFQCDLQTLQNILPNLRVIGLNWGLSDVFVAEKRAPDAAARENVKVVLRQRGSCARPSPLILEGRLVPEA